MRVAVLDIGTNTVLLLIAEMQDGKLVTIADHHAIARLGEGVDRTRRISDAAYERFIAILREHRKVIEQNKCDKIVAIATSAMRDAENRDEIIARTHRATGIQIKLLSGSDEAQWTYRGAIAGMNVRSGIGVIDIGGGSTEIAYGDANAFEGGTSCDIGAVRITERFFSNRPSAQAREAASKYIRQVLSSAKTKDISELIAVAGTPTTLAAMDQRLEQFDVGKVHGYILSRDSVQNLLDIMFTLSTNVLLEEYPCVNKARADILPAGTLILAEAMDMLGISEARVSTQGLRYGIALRELS